MISALGHCEDPGCSSLSTSNHELVRLFRCSIHCDRLLCLYHLNAHNVYYEEEKKQNEAVLNELQNNLTVYQTIFEQHIQQYRELVHQATTLLLHNTSAIIPIEQIRPVLERLQRAIAMFQQEKVIIKNEPILDSIEFELDPNLFKENSSVKKEINTPDKNSTESNRTVVVRLERIDYNINNEQINKDECSKTCKDTDNDQTTESNKDIHDEEPAHVLRPRKPTDENQRPKNLSPASGKKKCERLRKKPEKTMPLKRLQT